MAKKTKAQKAIENFTYISNSGSNTLSPSQGSAFMDIKQAVTELEEALRLLVENPKPITSARSAAKHGFDSFAIKNANYNKAVENAKKLLNA